MVAMLEAAMMLNEEKYAWTNHIAAFLGFSLSQVNWVLAIIKKDQSQSAST